MKIVGNMILIASSIIVNYLFLPALPLNSVKLVSSRQMPNSRTRKAGVTGSSPVAGSIALVQLRSVIASELFCFRVSFLLLRGVKKG